MILFDEDNIFRNTTALQAEADCVPLSSDEKSLHDFFCDYDHYLDFSDCRNEESALSFLNRNGVDFALSDVVHFAEIIGVLVWLFMESDDISADFKMQKGIWNRAFWKFESNVSLMLLQTIAAEVAVWEYDNVYNQGGNSWLVPYLPEYTEIDGKGYCMLSDRCSGLYHKLHQYETAYGNPSKEQQM